MSHVDPRLLRGWHHSRMVDSTTNTLTRLVSDGIRDLSSEVHLVGRYPISVSSNYSIWKGNLGKDFRVAVKLLRLERTMDAYEELLDELIHEAILWSRAMHHENVVPLYGVACLKDSVALISEWMDGSDLRRYLDAHPDAVRENLFIDIASALVYLHSIGITYLVLQPATVLVSSSGRACLGHFHTAYSYEAFQPTNILDSRLKSLAPSGTNPTQSPHSRNKLPPPIDVYNFGLLILEVLMDISDYLDYLEVSIPQRPENVKGLTDELWGVVQSCLHKDPTRRPGMAEVLQRLIPLTTNHEKRPGASHNVLKNITSEIRGISEHSIASGGFCDLYLGDRLGMERVALKLVRFFRARKEDQDAARRCFFNEAWLWADLQHPRILPFYGICQQSDLAFFMVSPFLKHGNIMEYLGRTAMNANRHRLLHEAAEGLLYLHSREPPVVHGDMKGANILITDHGTAVLADFGLSKLSDEETTTMLHGAGSPRWMAPELVMSENQWSEPSKTVQSDVYAFGQVMLEVLSGQLPFFNVKDVNVLVHLIQGRRSPRPEGPIAAKWLDDEAWRLILKYTANDVQERPIMKTVVSEIGALSTRASIYAT